MLVTEDHALRIPVKEVLLDGILNIPKDALGLVIFVHGSGSSRFSKRNQQVATVLNNAKLATLLFDLFTPEEDEVDNQTRELRFNISFLAERLVEVTKWCHRYNLTLGYFGASTGGGAALMAAAKEASVIKAVVSRGGRPDLAEGFLEQVKAPTLLIVGGADEPVIEMNEFALSKLQCTKALKIVPGATHLFEEPGTLDKVAALAKDWFVKYLS